jgi:hypothetical protein
MPMEVRAPPHYYYYYYHHHHHHLIRTTPTTATTNNNVKIFNSTQTFKNVFVLKLELILIIGSNNVLMEGARKVYRGRRVGQGWSKVCTFSAQCSFTGKIAMLSSCLSLFEQSKIRLRGQQWLSIQEQCISGSARMNIKKYVIYISARSSATFATRIATASRLSPTGLHATRSGASLQWIDTKMQPLVRNRPNIAPTGRVTPAHIFHDTGFGTVHASGHNTTTATVSSATLPLIPTTRTTHSCRRIHFPVHFAP